MVLGVLVFLYLPMASTFSYSAEFVDDKNDPFVLTQPPCRVVSLVPAITEIIFKLGVQDALKGMTYHSSFSGASGKTIVGGFFGPSVTAIHKLNPDLIFISSLHTDVKAYFKDKNVLLVELKTTSVLDGINTISLLGQIFDKPEQARVIRSKIDEQIDLITQKLNRIKPDQKLRVMRLMGRDQLMTPGNDSFQNDLIRMSGGIPPDFDKKGAIVSVTKAEWMHFNPQVIYGCGQDSEIEQLILTQPGWKDVDAVKNKRIYYFPCDLTCRAATNTGYFVQWLASSIYGKQFALAENLFFEPRIIASKSISPDFDCIEKIRVDDTHILDFVNKSLVIDLKSPMAIVSSLEGRREGIQTIVNHYSPPQNWMIDHDHDIDAIRRRITKALDKNPAHTSVLITGADMDNLAVKTTRFKDLKVGAFVTAGVTSNAMRMGKSKGHYYEPGTINIILVTNMKLSPRAMTRAIITATEAKTAALLDMDIRTSYDDGAFRATGTGTDNVLVVEGTGPLLDHTGGHTKLGEMMAHVVYEGVQAAVLKQNSLDAERNIFLRLKERGISIYEVIALEKNCDCAQGKSRFASEVEALLLDPKYSGFLQITLSISDDYQKGLIKDLSSFEAFCRNIASDICGLDMDELEPMVQTDLPHVIRMGLNALLNGIHYRDK
jgi:adenosylcobinamide amidohydrolase/ABC-type Fe3+-hydroxamate transport system substrate-binding protein